jgi:hypothetical protein
MRPVSDPARTGARLPRVSRLLLALATAASAVLAPGAALGQAFGPIYRVSAFDVEYALDHPGHIPTQELLDLEVGLRSTAEAYRLLLGHGDPAHQPAHRLHLQPPPLQRRDRHGRTRLRLRIWTGRVSRVTTLADGDRFGGLATDERTNNAAHDWIRDRSPVRPGGPRGLLDIQALEDYAAELSRHPGRRVDVELEAGDRPGTTRSTRTPVPRRPRRTANASARCTTSCSGATTSCASTT